MVELRKRKTPPPAPPAPVKKSKPAAATKAAPAAAKDDTKAKGKGKAAPAAEKPEAAEAHKAKGKAVAAPKATKDTKEEVKKEATKKEATKKEATKKEATKKEATKKGAAKEEAADKKEEQPAAEEKGEAAEANAADAKTAEKEAAPAAPKGPPAVGSTIIFDGFGGTVQTHAGEDTTLAALVEASKGGVVLFTYPKASTPGCTTQAKLFSESHEALTSASGLEIYGLSTDGPKPNSNFKDKQGLKYTLLCDPKAALIGAIGFKKAAGGAVRGVFVVDKQGKVLVNEAGGPAATVEVVKKLVAAGSAKE